MRFKGTVTIKKDLPMKEKSTPTLSKPQSEVSHTSTPHPSKRAMEFIRQFARAYQVIPTLSAGISGFVAN